MGLAQIRKYTNDLILKRKKIFERYDEAFKITGWAEIPPSFTDEKETSYHVYLLRIKNITEDQRNTIIEEINKKEVAVNVHFIPLPMLKIFRDRNYEIKNYPVSYDNYSREITLPVYPQLTDDEISTVINSVTESYKSVIQS